MNKYTMKINKNRSLNFNKSKQKIHVKIKKRKPIKYQPQKFFYLKMTFELQEYNDYPSQMICCQQIWDEVYYLKN